SPLPHLDQGRHPHPRLDRPRVTPLPAVPPSPVPPSPVSASRLPVPSPRPVSPSPPAALPTPDICSRSNHGPLGEHRLSAGRTDVRGLRWSTDEGGGGRR